MEEMKDNFLEFRKNIDNVITYLTNLRNEINKNNANLVEIFISEKQESEPFYNLYNTVTEFEPIWKEKEILIRDFRRA